MKKVLAGILVLATLCCLAGCAKTNNINIEDFSDKHSVMYRQSKYVAYYCEFENGILTVDRNTYRDSATSPSGVTLDSTETATYYYSLDGDNYITVNGEKYYYRAYKEAKHEHYVEFSVPFLGIATKWEG